MNDLQKLNSPGDAAVDSKHRWLFLATIVFVLAAGFLPIDHSPRASSHFRHDAEFIDSENRTADRVEAINVVSAPVRLVLGIAGVAFLLLPPKRQEKSDGNGRLRFGGIILLCMFSFLAYSAASTLWSVNPPVTLHKVAVLCCFGVAAYGLARQLSLFALTMTFSAVCLGYILLGVFAEIVLGNFTPHKGDYRFVGTCHPNTLAVYGTFLCLTATIYISIKPKLTPLMIAFFAVGFITLLATKSRTTLAGFVFAVVAVRFLTLRPHMRVFASSVAGLALVAGIAFLVLSRSNVRAAMADSMAMGRTEDVSSLTGRLPLWEELIISIKERPFVGYGYLAFWEKEKIDYLSALLGWEIPHGHNMYLDVLLDGGAIGLTLFMSMFVVPLIIAFHRCILYHDRQVAIVFGLLFFALVHGFAESLFKLPTFLSFMLLTLVLRMSFTDPPMIDQQECAT